MNKFSLLNQINRFIYDVYNAYSTSRLNTIDRKYIKVIRQNARFRNSKKGICFVIGNGPSLKRFDLTFLNRFDTFTANHFYSGIKDIPYESSFHAMIDNNFQSGDNLEFLIDLYKRKETTYFIFRHYLYDILKARGLDLNRAIFTYQKHFLSGDKLKLDLTKNTTACINVIICCIQTAIYMGYDRIYLVGCDFSSYATTKLQHFYETDDDKISLSMAEELKYYSLAHEHLYAIEKYAVNNGIKIINLSKESLIDAFEKADIQDQMSFLCSD